MQVITMKLHNLLIDRGRLRTHHVVVVLLNQISNKQQQTTEFFAHTWFRGPLHTYQLLLQFALDSFKIEMKCYFVNREVVVVIVKWIIHQLHYIFPCFTVASKTGLVRRIRFFLKVTWYELLFLWGGRTENNNFCFLI